MTEPQNDPELAARLRELSEQRITARIQAARRQAEQRKRTRAEFATRRRVGLRGRHATKAARQNLTQLHQQKGTQP